MLHTQRLLGGEALQLEPELCYCENGLFSPKILEPEMLKSHDKVNVQTKTRMCSVRLLCKICIALSWF